MDKPSAPRFYGIVLAAGASTRMGQPKALLTTANGVPLVMKQAEILKQAGAEHCCMVLGYKANTIQKQLKKFDGTMVINPRWSEGRLTSFQAGLGTVPDGWGAILLPVDAAGILPDTLHALAMAGHQRNAACLRPVWQNQPGHVRWLAPPVIPKILALASTPDFRMDQWFAPHEAYLNVDDPAILNNLNTPKDWEAFQLNVLNVAKTSWGPEQECGHP